MIQSRRSIRLPSYDYTANGAYFITICTHEREHSLGEIINGKMKLSVIGEIVLEKWFDIPNHHDHVKLGEFIIMPNHIHGIIWIVGASSEMFETNKTVGAHLGVPAEKSLGVPAEKSLGVPAEKSPGVPAEKSPGMTYKLSHGLNDMKERVCQGKPRRKPQRIHFREFGKPQSGSSSMIINQFKGSVKRWCNKNDNKWFKWQRNYYEHIIRNEEDLFNTSVYIERNPINWRSDEYKT